MVSLQIIVENINKSLENISFNIPSHSATVRYENEIKEAHAYPLNAGGKRIRPMLTLLTAGALGGEKGLKTAQRPALALEMLHTYTLVHDDLPCMDNDDLRRGKPTTHKIWGDGKALLVGDGLLTQSFITLAETNWPQNKDYSKELFNIFSQAAAPQGVIWGQWLDLSLTAKEETTWELMEIVHTYKTGLLIAACFEIGFVCGLSHLSKEFSLETVKNSREKIRKAGIHIGLAFQIIDDILDGTKSTNELGKTAGKDDTQNKFTALKLLGEKKSIELSKYYTDSAMNILKEIFSEFRNSENQGENSCYEINLFDLLQNLLARSN